MLATSQAATITWTNTGTPTVDESNINLSGTFVHAGKWGIGSRSVTMGGETLFFADAGTQNLAAPTPGTANVIASASGEGQDVGLYVAPGAINSDFLNVMNGGGWDGPNPKRVILNNLVPGAFYQVQLFVSDDRACCSGRTQKWSDNVTSGAGSETSTFSCGSSSFVIGTFTADATTQTIYAHGVAQTANIVNSYILREIVGADADSDGLPDYWETLYSSPPSATSLAAGDDLDTDGLSNLEEFQRHTNPTVGDTDNDGLDDGLEVNTYHTSPLMTDTDADGLTDQAEVEEHHSNPLLADSDNDGFTDLVEVNATPPKNPNDNTSNPAGVTAVKRGFNSLIGGDVTDPENDGNSTTATGTNFNWAAISASVNGTFLGEGAYNLFDNAVGVTSSKWYIANISTVTPPWLRTNFTPLTSLSGITLTSGNDAPDRDPVKWELQGSNDGTVWTPLFTWDYGSPWAVSERNHTYSITFPKKTYPYRQFRFQVFKVASGVATGAFQLDELEYIGESTDADNDGDGIPKLVEEYYAFLSDSNGNDGFEDYDNDGLSNSQEYDEGTNLAVADTDNDGLEDGEEFNTYLTDPKLADSDSDGLKDGQEVGPGSYGTNPKLADTDGDGFSDGQEVNSVPPTNPLDANSAPFKITILGTGTAALLGGDLTDPENDLNDNVGSPTTTNNAGSGFNWVSVTTNSTKNYFNGSSQTSGTNEGMLNLFDNKVGGGEAKWCCETAPKFITVQFAAPVSLTHFTIASGNDALDRSPSEWNIAGSNDGVNFTTIVADTSPNTYFWTAPEQVLRFDLNAPAPPYTYLRFTIADTPAVTNPSTNSIQLSEVEFFTASEPVLPVTQYGFNATGGFEITVGNLDTGLSYQLFRSSTLANPWTAVGTPVTPASATQTFVDDAPPPGRALYRVEDVPPP